MARGQIPPFARTLLSREASAWLQLVLEILERVGSHPGTSSPLRVHRSSDRRLRGNARRKGVVVPRRGGVAEERATRGVARSGLRAGWRRSEATRAGAWR